ncbi:MAG: hypothetical protein SH850_08060 [Planctomycetaceae bacterium]|nr:hypothetical protein [Planctomycetaceae bacterium]
MKRKPNPPARLTLYVVICDGGVLGEFTNPDDARRKRRDWNRVTKSARATFDKAQIHRREFVELEGGAA